MPDGSSYRPERPKPFFNNAPDSDERLMVATWPDRSTLLIHAFQRAFYERGGCVVSELPPADSDDAARAYCGQVRSFFNGE